MKQKGLKFLSLRNLNQDPVENLFCQIRQHGISNVNPTCHQFVAALKTIVINNFSVPLTRNTNCEDDYCSALGDLSIFLQNYCLEDVDSNRNVDINVQPLNDIICEDDFEELNFGSSYVAGYLLSKVAISECSTCKDTLFSDEVNSEHLYVYLKEYDNKKRLAYASSQLIKLVDTIHISLYKFLDKYGHTLLLEDNFKMQFAEKLKSFNFCPSHDVHNVIVDKCIRLTIFKYVKEKALSNKRYSDGHFKKNKKFKAL